MDMTSKIKTKIIKIIQNGIGILFFNRKQVRLCSASATFAEYGRRLGKTQASLVFPPAFAIFAALNKGTNLPVI